MTDIIPQPEAHQHMQERLWRCLAHPETKRRAREDFVHTLAQIGMTVEKAEQLVDDMFLSLADRSRPLFAIEKEIFGNFNTVPLGDTTLTKALDAKMTGRAQLIFNQIQDHVKDTTGAVIDFGCGDGQVTKMIADTLQRQQVRVVGVDVRDYRADHAKSVPFSLVGDKSRVQADPGAFEMAVLTNVLHHEADNEAIMHELDRVVTDRLVVIETVPIGHSEEEMEADKDRTFMNDYFYNRLLHDPAIDVPVPGAFETPQGWRERFAQHGWKVKMERDLGVDQEIIHDRHYLMVLEREKPSDSPAR